jgi:hypothetical protein
MPTIRLPESAEPLLPFCRRFEEPLDNACFDTYADFVSFMASCGYHRLHGRLPADPEKFLPNIYPIDLAVFKNQSLFPNLLLIALGTEGKSDIARDEERLCRVVEAFADVGCKYLAHESTGWTPARFHLQVANLLCETIESSGNTDKI